MHPRRILIILSATVGLGLGCLALLSGCGDDSKTTGTQVQISPETKAAIKDMRTAQKEVQAERKQERQARKKGR